MAQTSQQSSPASDASDAAADTDLKRGLSARHMQMIAIGGAIGTGLFVASGKTISTAGPGGAIVAYGLIGIMVLFLMQSLGEMAAHLPVPGSFQTYATRYVSSSFGFAMGWNYWFNWAITVAAELVAVGEVMKYWLPETPSWVWAGIFLVLLTGLNALSAKAYGEGEFWLATIKVVTVIVFLIAGIAMIFGVLGGASPGTSNWTTGEAPFVGGPVAIFTIFMVAGFSFVGVESAAVAAGEAENPRRTMPRAINSVFVRIMLFYIGAIIVVATLVVYTDPSLLSASEENIAASPFTIVFERAGLAIAAAFMNAVVLTSVLSAGNSTLYVGSRLLYSITDIFIAHKRSCTKSQCRHGCACERRNIKDDGGVAFGGEGNTIRHDQATFGIAIENFNRAAVTNSDDVFGAQGGSAGHILGKAKVSGDLNRNFQLGRRKNCVQNRCCTCHVAFHRHHRCRRF